LLATSEDVLLQIKGKRDELESILISQENGGVGVGAGAAPAETSPWAVIKLIIFIVLFLLRLATCSHW